MSEDSRSVVGEWETDSWFTHSRSQWEIRDCIAVANTHNHVRTTHITTPREEGIPASLLIASIPSVFYNSLEIQCNTAY